MIPSTRCWCELVEVAVLARRVAVAVAQEQREPGLLGGRLGAARDVGEERVRGVEEDIGERPAAALPQLARRLVAHEAEARHLGLHARARLVAARSRAG